MDDQKGQSYNAIEAFTLKTNKRIDFLWNLEKATVVYKILCLY